MLAHIKPSWLESDAVYGNRKVHPDLRGLRKSCGRNWVYRLMRLASLESQTSYDRRPGHHRDRAATVVVPNHLQQQFEVAAPS